MKIENSRLGPWYIGSPDKLNIIEFIRESSVACDRDTPHLSRLLNFEMFYIYILKSENNSFYIGSCESLDKRIALHNKGFVRSTKRGIPWKLVHQELFLDFKSARQRELKIKSWKSREAIQNLIIADPR